MDGVIPPPNDTVKMLNPPRRASHIDPGQYLENLATAYWYSETFFAALELDIFTALADRRSLTDLAQTLSCKPAGLKRLLITLEQLQLIQQNSKGWQITDSNRPCLLRDSPQYMGDFLLYRRYLQAPWQNLADKISNRPLPERLSPDDSYQKRSRHYVRAMDALARRKAVEIAELPITANLLSPILDIGGGAGALSRHLLKKIPDGRAVLLEMAEVLATAQDIYPEDKQQNIEKLPGDFRKIKFKETFGTILIANMLHIYSADEARQLLNKAAGLLMPGGLIIIHDYFPDRPNPCLAKGALYDLNMMLNTYEGQCHNSTDISQWLRMAGCKSVNIHDLASDTSIIAGSLI